MDTQQLKESYDRDGYLFMPGFLSEEEMHELNEKLASYLQDVVPGLPPQRAVYQDPTDPGSLVQLFYMDQYDSYYNYLLNDSKFRWLAELLLGERVIPQNLEFFNKPPRIGKPTPPHQDNYYFMLTPPAAVTLWLALEEVDAENGCVRYVRGSHQQGMRPHGRTKTVGFSQGMTDFGTENDWANEVALPAKPGDLLIHHSMTVHWADGNQSLTRTRRALGFIYFAESAREDKVKKEAYQRELKAQKEAYLEELKAQANS
ncbi:hypothetical protein GCM10028803_42540 [Larkinella knui]|uniref:Phytanoyl-CoA dioxygenase family protein n=1 Tax=Larkinella knui TaxID=2025310 RepID=A0A3P1CNI9_9BACT|nr:phytanoyl-CoA dioxygenase family protein [Larkinella knui]RRB14882.1 phytanoyl-CoA dioxygenase family protein [Larkinella knui]